MDVALLILLYIKKFSISKDANFALLLNLVFSLSLLPFLMNKFLLNFIFVNFLSIFLILASELKCLGLKVIRSI